MSTGTSDIEMASEFQKVFSLGINDYNRSLLAFLKEKNMIFPGCRVLDIGCGVGKHGTYFASLGCEVTLTDISPAMLERAEANMAEFTVPWRTLLLDFSSVPVEELPFQGKFDLVFSSMCPAIGSIEAIKKMSAVTDGWCFVTNFISWSQPGRDRFYRALGMDTPSEIEKRVNMLLLLEAMKSFGIAPETVTVPYSWCDRRSKDEAVRTLLWHRGIDISADTSLLSEAYRVVESMCDEDGLFTDSVDTTVMWILWKAKNMDAE